MFQKKKEIVIVQREGVFVFSYVRSFAFLFAVGVAETLLSVKKNSNSSYIILLV